MRHPNQIRQLQPGEAVPVGEPRRYRNASGYVRLRWKLGPYSYVEVYEHRLVAGLHAREVHHVNRVRDDNAPDNLMPVTTTEHGAEHATWPIAEACELYAAGWSLPALANRYGVVTPQILRSLRLRGVQMRRPADTRRAQRPVCEGTLRRLSALGLGVRAIATAMGETRIVIKNRMRLLGLTPRRPGNYTRAERQQLAAHMATKHQGEK